MIPVIDKIKTGVNLRRMMDKWGLSVRDVQEFLGLSSVQSIYHWLNGISMPTVDNLYALSHLFKVSIDDIVCGNKPSLQNDSLEGMVQRIIYYNNMLVNVLKA